MSHLASEEESKKFQKLTHVEHVLVRPDTYVGSTQRTEIESWLLNDASTGFVLRKFTFIPALFKIFDEVVVNAADNKVRNKSQTAIDISIDPASGRVVVRNDGPGISTKVHRDHKIHIPQMIFGELLTGTNYDDSEKKIVGGRNGYGAKLANIYSQYFSVRTVSEGNEYFQEWHNNMSKMTSPVIKAVKRGKEFTEVAFIPDMSRFQKAAPGEESTNVLDDDTVALFRKRAYDLAGTTGCTVTLNGYEIPVKSFKEYVAMYPASGLSDDARMVVKGERNGPVLWEVMIGSSDGQGFHQVSFVNSVWTAKGGTHVDYIVKQLIEDLQNQVNKDPTLSGKKKGGAGKGAKGKEKDAKGGKKAAVTSVLRPYMVKSSMFVFINARIVNPSFGSQWKDTLTTPVKEFGSKCELSKKALDSVRNSSLMAHVLFQIDDKARKTLNQGVQNRSRVVGIPKLDDANNAGTRLGKQCTLILTEGDSAKTLAVAGLSVVGRDNFGIFPLRGKLMNVRVANAMETAKNEELSNIMKALGLKVGMKTFDQLRYGKVMIMCDQDVDGSHIKGLIINFFHNFWPKLVEANGFLEMFQTPVLKAFPQQKGKPALSFYSEPEFARWMEALTDRDRRKYRIKYYKGLGTSSHEESREYFSDIEKHRKRFVFTGEQCDSMIKLAFENSLGRADQRKRWMATHREGSFLNSDVRDVRIGTDFIDKELVIFWRADCARSIPSLLDGFKPSQRKILYSAFKHRSIDRHEVKIAQLSGYVLGVSAYHHGEVALQDTIIGMAHDFVGSNNINLFLPIGIFGSRRKGGKDRAAARYISTKLSPVTRCIFPPSDDAVLDFKDEEGRPIEPEHYLPIIPMVLVNGSKGIGTGWSANIPSHNPRDLIEGVRALIDGKEPEPLKPWYRGFSLNHLIEPTTNSWYSYGAVRRDGPNIVHVTELPVQMWTQTFKESLEEWMISGFIYMYREHHTEATVHFEIAADPSVWDRMAATDPADPDRGILLSLGLRNHIMKTLVAFDVRGHVRKFDSAVEMMKEWFPERMQGYCARKQHLMKELYEALTRLSNMVRFIELVISDQLVIRQKKTADVVAELKALKFAVIDPTAKLKAMDEDDEDDEDVARRRRAGGAAEEGEVPDAEGEAVRGYRYLLSMPMISMTRERVAKLKQQHAEKEAELHKLANTSEATLWRTDLDALLAALDADDLARAEAGDTAPKVVPTTGGASRKGRRTQGAVKAEQSLCDMKLSVPALSKEAVAALDKFMKTSKGPVKAKAAGAGAAKNGKGKVKEEAEVGEDGLPVFEADARAMALDGEGESGKPAKRTRATAAAADGAPKAKRGKAAVAAAGGEPKAKPAAKRTRKALAKVEDDDGSEPVGSGEAAGSAGRSVENSPLLKQLGASVSLPSSSGLGGKGKKGAAKRGGGGRKKSGVSSLLGSDEDSDSASDDSLGSLLGSDSGSSDGASGSGSGESSDDSGSDSGGSSGSSASGSSSDSGSDVASLSDLNDVASEAASSDSDVVAKLPKPKRNAASKSKVAKATSVAGAAPAKSAGALLGDDDDDVDDGGDVKLSASPVARSGSLGAAIGGVLKSSSSANPKVAPSKPRTLESFGVAKKAEVSKPAGGIGSGAGTASGVAKVSLLLGISSDED